MLELKFSQKPLLRQRWALTAPNLLTVTQFTDIRHERKACWSAKNVPYFLQYSSNWLVDSSTPQPQSSYIVMNPWVVYVSMGNVACHESWVMSHESPWNHGSKRSLQLFLIWVWLFKHVIGEHIHVTCGINTIWLSPLYHNVMCCLQSYIFLPHWPMDVASLESRQSRHARLLECNLDMWIPWYLPQCLSISFMVFTSCIMVPNWATIVWVWVVWVVWVWCVINLKIQWFPTLANAYWCYNLVEVKLYLKFGPQHQSIDQNPFVFGFGSNSQAQSKMDRNLVQLDQFTCFTFFLIFHEHAIARTTPGSRKTHQRSVHKNNYRFRPVWLHEN